jgi:hypothetical protein
MKYTSLIATCLLLSSLSIAGEHALGAHEHGSIKLGFAVEKNTVEISLDGPTESFIGFEYIPHTDKEKTMFNNAKNLWEKNILDLITFDKKLNCKMTGSSFKQVIDQKETAEAQAQVKDQKKKEGSVHSDIEAQAKITCIGSIAGSEVQVSLKKHFKNIKKITAEILSTETKSVEITKQVQAFKI